MSSTSSTSSQYEKQTHEEEDWRNGLCSHVCGGSFSDCLGSWFCPCLWFGKVATRMRTFPAEDSSACNGSCASVCFASCVGLGCLPVFSRRKQFRSQHYIKGSCCGDFMAAWCCTPCSIAQLNTEVKDRAQATRNAHNGYARRAGGMAYQPMVMS